MFSSSQTFRLHQINMASADVARPIAPLAAEKTEPFKDTPKTTHNVETVLNYYLENEDGSPPEPSYVE